MLSTNAQKVSLCVLVCVNRFTHLSTAEASIQRKCHTYLVVLETGGLSGLGEATEPGLVEAGLGAGDRTGEQRRGKKQKKEKEKDSSVKQ